MRISDWSSDVCSSDGVVGFGGGSSMDIAKLVALLGNSDQPLAEMYGIGNAKGRRLPRVQVPTTAGTGSEVTGISTNTPGESENKGVVRTAKRPVGKGGVSTGKPLWAAYT